MTDITMTVATDTIEAITTITKVITTIPITEMVIIGARIVIEVTMKTDTEKKDGAEMDNMTVTKIIPYLS